MVTPCQPATRLNPNYDPTKKESVTNPQYIRTPFPDNKIPQERWNSVGAALLNAYPAPNNGTGLFNNYLSSPNLSLDKFRNWLGRVDHNFSNSDRLSFVANISRYKQLDQFFGSTFRAPLAGGA